MSTSAIYSFLLLWADLLNRTNAKAFDNPLYPKPEGLGFTGHSYKVFPLNLRWTTVAGIVIGTDSCEDIAHSPGTTWYTLTLFNTY